MFELVRKQICDIIKCGVVDKSRNFLKSYSLWRCSENEILWIGCEIWIHNCVWRVSEMWEMILWKCWNDEDGYRDWGCTAKRKEVTKWMVVTSKFVETWTRIRTWAVLDDVHKIHIRKGAILDVHKIIVDRLWDQKWQLFVDGWFTCWATFTFLFQTFFYFHLQITT